MDDADYKPGDEVVFLWGPIWDNGEVVATDPEAICLRAGNGRLRVVPRHCVRRPVPKPLPRLKTAAVELFDGERLHVVECLVKLNWLYGVKLTSQSMQSMHVCHVRRILPQEGGNDPDLEARLREAMAQHNQQTKEPEA